jgi:hypothetical protein
LLKPRKVDITYNGNEAILVLPTMYDAGDEINTEIRITIDADRKPLKRIEYRQAIDPVYSDYRYSYDTLTFQYNAEGLLTRATGYLVDSGTWYPGQLWIRRGTHTIDYTNTDNNITGLNEFYNTKTSVRSYNEAGLLSQVSSNLSPSVQTKFFYK